MKEHYSEYKANNHESNGEQMKQTNLNVYLMSFCRMFLITFAVVAFSTGCSTSSNNQPSTPASSTSSTDQYANSTWPKLHHNNSNSGESLHTSPVPTGTLKWDFFAGSKVDSSPAIGSDGTIYVGCENGNLYALNPADGSQKWAYLTGGVITTSSPAISADGTIYIGSHDAYLYAIYPDGSLKWKSQTGDSEASSPAIGADGTIYLASRDYNLYALNPADGSLKWKFATGNAMADSPAIGSDGTIYIGSNDNNLYAVNPDGTKKWSFKTNNGMSMPSIDFDGTIYVGSLNGRLYALNSSGTQLWEVDLWNPIEAVPAIGPTSIIYVGTVAAHHSTAEAFYAIAPNGGISWGFKTGNVLASSAAIGFDGTIYLGSQETYFIALDSVGFQKWSFETRGTSINSSPAIGSDGTIYFGADDGYVYAVD
jgi:outer membrane protein assembly factor BamB